MNTKIKLAVFLLAFFVSLSPFAIPPIKQSKADTSTVVSRNQEWTTDRVITGNLEIKAGVILRVKKGVTITFSGGNIEILGKMILDGTARETIKLRRDEGARAYSINVEKGASLVMRNVDMSGAGMMLYLMQGKSFLNTANAAFSGGVNINNGSFEAQSCNFHDNEIAIAINYNTNGKTIVNRSKFSNNSRLDVGFTADYASHIPDFRYNWWGSPDGPKEICEEFVGQQYCHYEKVNEGVDFSNWLSSEVFHDPVVIIPGVFGSQKQKDVWKIDPIFHTYDNLIDEFKNNGYVLDVDLFLFPYDWRDSNIDNAKKLEKKILEIKTITNWPKVDVVAHSMGGLLSRQYIQSSNYQEDVDQLITLGTPNMGAPEIYPLWEAGKPIGIVQSGMKKFLQQEMKEAGYSNMFEYIRKRPIFSAKELLPTYAYLYDLEDEKPLAYPSEHPFNEFLDNLNNQIGLQNLTKVEYTKIVGKVTSSKSTISGFEVMRRDMGKIWEHGYPISFEIPVIGDRGTLHGRGDGTVPLASGKSVKIPADNYVELNSSHINLPTKAQGEVLEILTRTRPGSEVTDSTIKNMLQFFVYSPVDIQIISPSGKKVGKNFESGEIFDEIPGAFYAGYEDENGNEVENEFITIPNPEEGKYRILTQRTGNGSYQVEAVNLSENENDPFNLTESVANFQVTDESGDGKEFEISVAGTEIIGDFEDQKDSVAPSTKIEISGLPGSNGWLKSDATVKLNASDNEGGSGIDKTKYSLDGGATWFEYLQPFLISQEGPVTIQYFSSDKQGNIEETKSKKIEIDKTVPEAKIFFNPGTQEFEIKGIDNLSQNVTVVVAEQPKTNSPKESGVKSFSWLFDFFQKLKQEKNSRQKNIYVATLTDEAENVTNVIFEKRRDENHRIELLISSVAYNGIVQDLQTTSLKYKWIYSDKKKTFLMFAQNVRTAETFVEAHYRPKKNVTIIMQKPQEFDDRDEDDDCDFRPIRQKLSGLVIVSLQTEKGKVKISY